MITEKWIRIRIDNMIGEPPVLLIEAYNKHKNGSLFFRVKLLAIDFKIVIIRRFIEIVQYETNMNSVTK